MIFIEYADLNEGGEKLYKRDYEDFETLRKFILKDIDIENLKTRGRAYLENLENLENLKKEEKINTLNFFFNYNNRRFQIVEVKKYKVAKWRAGGMKL